MPAQVPRAEQLRQESFYSWQSPPDPDWMTKAEVARYARVSVSTVERLVSDGIIEAYRVGHGRNVRFKRADVEASVFGMEPTKATRNNNRKD